MTPNNAPIVAARVLMRHGLSDDVIFGYIARSWPLDTRQCDAAIAAARFLVDQEAAVRQQVWRRALAD